MGDVDRETATPKGAPRSDLRGYGTASPMDPSSALQVPPSPRQSVDLFVAQATGHDHDGNREARRRLSRERRDQRAGAVLARSGGEHQEGDILVLVDEREDGLAAGRRSGSPARARRRLNCGPPWRRLRGAFPPRRALPRSSLRRRRSIRNCPAGRPPPASPCWTRCAPRAGKRNGPPGGIRGSCR